MLLSGPHWSWQVILVETKTASFLFTLLLSAASCGRSISQQSSNLACIRGNCSSNASLCLKLELMEPYRGTKSMEVIQSIIEKRPNSSRPSLALPLVLECTWLGSGSSEWNCKSIGVEIFIWEMGHYSILVLQSNLHLKTLHWELDDHYPLIPPKKMGNAKGLRSSLILIKMLHKGERNIRAHNISIQQCLLSNNLPAFFYPLLPLNKCRAVMLEQVNAT